MKVAIRPKFEEIGYIHEDAHLSKLGFNDACL
jgi:hypothetical protein